MLSKAPAACDYNLSRVLVHWFRKPQLRGNTRDSPKNKIKIIVIIIKIKVKVNK